DERMSTNALDHVDLGLWIRLVTERFQTNSSLVALKSRFDNCLGRIVAGSRIGQGYIDHDNQFIAKHGYSGISVYYPLTNQFIPSHPVSWCFYFGRTIPAQCRASLLWQNYLTKYFTALSERTI